MMPIFCSKWCLSMVPLGISKEIIRQLLSKLEIFGVHIGVHRVSKTDKLGQRVLGGFGDFPNEEHKVTKTVKLVQEPCQG